jgi:predicted esterase
MESKNAGMGVGSAAAGGAPGKSSAPPASHAVVFMHGLGDRGASWRSLPRQLGLDKDARIKWVMLDSPVEPVTVNRGAVMPSWFDLSEIPVRERTADDVKGLERSVALLRARVARLAAEDGIPAGNVVVGGFSQGGAVAALAAGGDSPALGGAIMLSGWAPLRSELPHRTARKGVAVFHGHGDEDSKVLPSLADASRRAMLDAGFDVTYRLYSGMDHETCGEEMADLREWLVARFAL